MRELVSTKRFERAYRRFVRRNRRLQAHIDKTLVQMQTDVFDVSLRAHKLTGTLLGLWACSCGYDCRIVFELKQDEEDEEYLLLIDIGTHDQVY